MAGSHTQRKSTGVSIASLSRKGIGGRPTSVTTEVIGKLEQAFAIGASDKEACFYANINPDTLYAYQKKYPQFSERKEALKLRPILAARQKVIDDINKDVNTAKWYLERKLKSEFSTKSESDTTIHLVQPIMGGVTKSIDVQPDDDN